jgi:hypothetical protein
MQKTLDTIWEFEDYNSKCHLQVYETPEQLSVAIVTELTGNPGTTITKAAAYLAAMIYERINRPLQNLIWIEHHNAGEGRSEGEESFDRVTFGNTPPFFDHPQRQPMTRAAVEELVGQEFAIEKE